MSTGAPTRAPAARVSPPLAVLCVGGCHRDVVARTTGAFLPGTSCPGSVAERPGGVARNVAVLLASAGLAVAFAGRVGDDPAGRALASGLHAAGLAAVDLAVDPAAATGTYVALHDAAGELVAAVSDLCIYDRIAPAALDEMPFIDAAGLVFADANLPQATLAALAARRAGRIAVDGISRAKAPRLAPCLDAGALLFLNLPSAESLLAGSFASPAAAAEALRAAGARRAVVTGGAQPVAVLDEGCISERPTRPVAVVDVTGAGDALTAGALAALAYGRPLAEAVDLGIRAAVAALAVTGALDRLPADVLAALGPSETANARPR